MIAQPYITRRRHHLRWMAKFHLAGVACFAMALYAWPRIGGHIAVAVGFVLFWLSARERRRAQQVGP